MRISLTLAVALLLFSFTAAHAADAYFVRFSSYGRGSSAGSVLWLDDVLFFNTNAAPASVRFLGVSNGDAQADAPPSLTLPPGRVISLDATAVAPKWAPILSVLSPYILHLDIPSGVIAESRDEFYFDRGIPELPPLPLGKVSMPIFRELAPAGTAQVQLGTDLSGTDSRENVGIYNAGNQTATAMIEVRRTCDDTVADTRTLSIPPNTLLQTNGLQTGAANLCGTPAANSKVTRYTIITVSQPSLSYVANLTDGVARPPGVDDTAPFVGLAVTQNSKF